MASCAEILMKGTTDMKKTIAILLSLLMVFGLAACSKNDTNTGDNSFYVYSKDYGFTKNEMAYLYNYVYSQSASYLSYLGVDTTKSLKDQEYMDGTSWFDYMMEQAVSYAKDFLIFSETAKDRGIELDEADMNQIQEELDAVLKSAKEAGFDTVEEFFNDTFGASMTSDEYKSFLEKSTLAYKVYSDIEKSYAFTNDQIQEHYTNNQNEFNYINYLVYSFAENADKGITAEAAEKSADELAAVTSAEAYKAYVENYINGINEDGALDVEAEMTKIEVNDMFYTQGDEISEWGFAADAAVNQTLVTRNTENHVYTVYLLTKLPYRHEAATVNVRHILVTADTYGSDEEAKAFAEKVLDEWKTGDATAVSFGELAKQYTEDQGSKATGGLYENVAEGDMVQTFNDWIFDPSRVVGDTGIVQTDYGYHIMYFEGKGYDQWQNEVISSMKQVAYSADYSALQKQYPITVETEKLNGIVE